MKIGKKQKILLGILPFWTPQIPPLGISCIKSYIKAHGYQNVKTVDANMEKELREIYDRYVNTLRSFIPGDKQGNYPSIVNEVWQNHMMAHLNYTDETGYKESIQTLARTVFFTSLEDRQVECLEAIVEENYQRLERYIVNLAEQEKPVVFALGVYMGTLPASLFAFKLVRERFPHIKNIMGGGVFYDQLAQGTDNLEYFLEKTREYIDALLLGEGEVLFLKYLQGELDESKRVFTQGDIDGEVLDLSKEQVPDFFDLPIGNYPYLSVYGSRSCPYRCTFCSDSVFWGKFRMKKPGQIVGELTELYRRHKRQLFYMSDLLMNPFVTRLAKEFLKSDLSLYWDGFLKVSSEVCNPEKAFLWRRAGLYRVGIGIESGSQRILDLMDKRITVEQSKAAIISLASAGIKTTTFWIIGYPGETDADFQATLDMMEEIQEYIYYAEGNVFWSILAGRPGANEWMKQGVQLYPERFREMLMIQTRAMDTEPTREERYKRLARFIAHCKNLGIQNTYSWDGLYRADERWQKLHLHAVPPITAFSGKEYIGENKHLDHLIDAPTIPRDDGNWGF